MFRFIVKVNSETFGANTLAEASKHLQRAAGGSATIEAAPYGCYYGQQGQKLAPFPQVEFYHGVRSHVHVMLSEIPTWKHRFNFVHTRTMSGRELAKMLEDVPFEASGEDPDETGFFDAASTTASGVSYQYRMPTKSQDPDCWKFLDSQVEVHTYNRVFCV